MTKILRTILILVTIVAVAMPLFVSPAFADQANAQTAIASSQRNIQNCYEAVEQAEAAGANIDSLLNTLNNAAGLLSEAQLAYAAGNYNSSYTYAIQSQSQLDGFISQTTNMKENAVNVRNQTRQTAVFSVIISIAILSIGISILLGLNRKGRRTV